MRVRLTLAAVASLALWIGFAGTLRPACAGGTEPKEAQA